MRLHKYFLGVALAGALFIHPVKAHSQESMSPMNSEGSYTTVASTSFCYAGSTIDPRTGEPVDLYNLCIDDLDMA